MPPNARPRPRAQRAKQLAANRLAMERRERVPYPFNNNPTYRRTFAYESSASESKDAVVVTSNCLECLMFAASSSTSGTSIVGAVRIVEVEMWGVSSSVSNEFSQMSLTWDTDYGPLRQITASGNTVMAGHIRSRPPRRSFAELWHNFGAPNDNLFSLSGPVGTIVYVTIDFTLVDKTSIDLGHPMVCSGATAGQLYCNTYLDNTASSFGAGTSIYGLQQVVSQTGAYASS
jgi:hypothetical protein